MASPGEVASCRTIILTPDAGPQPKHRLTQVIAEAILSISPEESDQTFAQMYLPIVTEVSESRGAPI